MDVFGTKKNDFLKVISIRSKSDGALNILNTTLQDGPRADRYIWSCNPEKRPKMNYMNW